MKLTGHTVLITGGTSGIGLELAHQLDAMGNTVIVTGRDAGRLAAMGQAHPKIHAVESDVSDPSAIVALHTMVLQRFPALNILINNAGIMRRLNLHALADEDVTNVTREVSINLLGPIQMIQIFLPHLKAQKVAAIVNVSSALAFAPYPLSPVYAASKAALHSYTQSLRVQMAGTRLRVIELAPPAIATPLNDVFSKQEVDPRMLMDAAKLVRAAIAGIERGSLEITPGLSALLRFLGRWAPGLIQQMFKKWTAMMLAESAPK